MKVNFLSKIATCVGLGAIVASGFVSLPAFADPAEPSATALVGVGSDTTMDVMDEIATAIGGGKLASYKSTGSQTITTRPGGPSTVLRAKGSGDGWKMLQVAEGASLSFSNVATFAASNQTANKDNTVGQIDYARASSLQGTASATGEFVDIPFAIDSVGIAVNPTDAVAKIPLTGLGTTADAAGVASIDAIFRCQTRFVYLNNVTIGSVAATNGSSTLTKSAHGLVAGDTITISSDAGGFSAGTKYYVKTVPSADTFTLQAEKGGATLSASSDGTLNVTQTSGSYNSVGASSGAAPANTTAYEIFPLIPGYGSGTASYFVGKIGRTESGSFPDSSAGQSCISRKFLDGTTNIQEHDGAAVAERENSIGIYSIGQWSAQTNHAVTGATDKTNGTVLLNLYPNGAATIPATTGSGSSIAPNENWTSDLKRYVYNIVPYRKAIDPDSAIHEMFVGTDSLVCQQTASIIKMGFTPLSSTDPANVGSCGSIASGNRRTAGGDGTSVTGASISNLSSTDGDVGHAVTATVKVGTSNHQMGGRVIVTDNATYGAAGANVLGSVSVAAGVAGDTATTIQITPIAVGTTALYAYFVPALGGIKVTPLVADGTSSTWTQNLASIASSSVTLSLKKPAKVGGNARVVAIIDCAVYPGGTVTLKNGSTNATIATDTLDADESAAVFTFAQTSAAASVYAVYTPTADSGVVTSTSATKSWTLTKLVPSIAVALAAAPNGLAAGTSPVWAVAAKNVIKAATVNATTDLVTVTGHGLVVGNAITFAASTTAPAGANKTSTYYVIASGLTANAFKVSATLGGSAVNFTSAGATVKVTQPNVAPKITATLTATDGTVTLKPTGALRVFYGSSANARTTEITVTGATMANGVATLVLDQTSLWAAVGAVTTTPTSGKYLTIVYGGDGAFDDTGYITKQVQFKSQ